MKAQIIEKDGRPEFAVIPYADYERFLELIEDEADARAVAEFHADYTAGKAFLVPDDILRRELAGESPVKLWRFQRNLTQQELSGQQVLCLAGEGNDNDIHGRAGRTDTDLRSS
jgi:hypothetical protein